MTLLQPGGMREFAAENYMRQLRLLATVLLQGQSGRVGVNDYNATPSNTSMDVQLAAGCSLIQMPGLYQGANVFASDAPVTKTLNAAPGSGTRHDVIGIQVWDQEYGDLLDSWDIVYLANPTVNSTTLPAPGMPGVSSPASAAWLPIVGIDVPAKVTTSNRCTFRHLASTVAQIRSGGYTGTDLALPPSDVVTHQENVVGAGGWVYSFIVPSPIGFGIATIDLVFTYPTGGTPNAVGGWILDRTRGIFSAAKTADYYFRVFRPDGSVLDEGSGIQYDAIYKPVR